MRKKRFNDHRICGGHAGVVERHGADGDWKKTWDETLAAAKERARSPSSARPTRDAQRGDPGLQRYGVKVDYIAGRSSEITERVSWSVAQGSMRSMPIFPDRTSSTHPACGKADRSAASLSHPAGGDGGQELEARQAAGSWTRTAPMCCAFSTASTV